MAGDAGAGEASARLAVSWLGDRPSVVSEHALYVAPGRALLVPHTRRGNLDDIDVTDA